MQEEEKVRTHTRLKQHFYKVEHGPGKEIGFKGNVRELELPMEVGFLKTWSMDG